MDELSTGYSYRILQMWSDIIEVAEKFRVSQLEGEGRIDSHIWNQYISKLTRLWLELEPEIKNISSNEKKIELENEFMEFRDLYYDPTKMNNQPEKIYKLEEVLRKALKEIKITRFE